VRLQKNRQSEPEKWQHLVTSELWHITAAIFPRLFRFCIALVTISASIPANLFDDLSRHLFQPAGQLLGVLSIAQITTTRSEWRKGERKTSRMAHLTVEKLRRSLTCDKLIKEQQECRPNHIWESFVLFNLEPGISSGTSSNYN
jgi:hypothetical protein